MAVDSATIPAPVTTVGSLCSGYFGLELALDLAGLNPQLVWYAELDPFAAKVGSHHHPDIQNLGDIKTIDWENTPRVDLLTAGYPCQPFSQAGKQRGTEDPRHLWPYVADAIGILGPRYVLLENVRGHVKLGLQEVIAELAHLGYVGSWGCVRASDVGAPHRRERVFILAAHANLQSGQELHVNPTGRGSSSRRDDAARSGTRRDAAADTDRVPGQRLVYLSVERTAEEAAVGLAADDSDTGDGGGRGRDQDVPDTDDGRRQQQRSGVGHLPVPGAGGSRSEDAADPTLTRRDGRSGVGQEDRAGSADHGREVVPDPDLTRSQGRDASDLPGPVDPVARRGGSVGSGVDSGIPWGPYGPAIARWEYFLGRPAPSPVEPSKSGQNRLNPVFVEWMMGLPEGWVTAVPSLSRTQTLKILGNGVVPQQAAHAILIHLARLREWTASRATAETIPA